MPKIHSTDYFNTLIEVAEDSPRETSAVPQGPAERPSVAMQQYALIAEHPYALTSDDVIFGVWAQRQGLEPEAMETARATFFSKGQPCLRTSPLAKTYGFGIHSDDEGRVALVPMESERYQQLLDDPQVTRVRAMRAKRK